MEKRNLFEEDRQLVALAEFNTSDRIKEVVDWGRFKPTLAEVFGLPRRRGPGLPSWDQMNMFRAILLGIMFSLNGRQLQYITGSDTDIAWVQEQPNCLGLKAFGAVKAERFIKRKTTSETR